MVSNTSGDKLYLDTKVALEQRRQAKDDVEAKISESPIYPPKQVKQFTMLPNTSSDSLYLDSNVALGQRKQSVDEMKANAAAFNKAEGQEGEGILAGMKHQLDTMAPGGSLSEFGNFVTSVAQEKILAVRHTLMEDTLPAAQGALRTVRGHIRSISGGSREVEETIPQDFEVSREEQECIDKMSNDQICDFLREKHMSNKHVHPPVSTK
ncbi:uncharacterized protein N7479_004291 [Penicillium vulpinum]|nr:uncharacterized protein N7479_004291 [Penicillium vulpinum]KAJ5964415.1 hypothetical protein N7479_004291 [Penicillium vulpinum]